MHCRRRDRFAAQKKDCAQSVCKKWIACQVFARLLPRRFPDSSDPAHLINRARLEHFLSQVVASLVRFRVNLVGYPTGRLEGKSQADVPTNLSHENQPALASEGSEPQT